MTYVRHTWQNDSTSTPLSAARLTEMEQGIFDAHYLPACRVLSTANAGAGVAVVVTLATVAYDTVNASTGGASKMFDGAAPTRITFRQPGFYVVGAFYNWAVAPSPSSYVGGRIRLNGVTQIGSQIVPTPYGYGYEQNLVVGYNFIAGDYVELVAISAGATANMASGAAFWAHMTSY